MVLALVCVGCGDTVDPGSLIDKTRILGVRAEVDADATQSWPQPGDAVTTRWLVASPDAIEPIGSAYFACIPAGTAFGPGQCEGEPFAFGINPPTVPANGEIELPLTIPTELDDGQDQVLMFGAFCFGGRISTDLEGVFESGNPCAGEGRGRIAILTVALDLGRQNAHPEIQEVAINDVPWVDAAPALPTTCAENPTLPNVVHTGGTDEEIEIVVNATPDSRETFMTEVGDPPETVERQETMRISVYSTHGVFSSQFIFIDEDEDGGAADVNWVLPEVEEIPAGGQVVNFFFVMRDVRGGVHWQSRALCLTRE